VRREPLIPERNLLEQSAAGGSRASRKGKVRLGGKGYLRDPKGSLRKPWSKGIEGLHKKGRKPEL